MTGDPVSFCPCSHPCWSVVPPPCTCGQHGGNLIGPGRISRPTTTIDSASALAGPQKDPPMGNKEVARMLRALADLLERE